MDRRDARILAALARDARATYDTLGRVVGLSGNAVKARVQALQRSGVLQGFHATPDPALLGAEEGVLAFDGVHDLAQRGDDILHQLPEVPGVLQVDVGVDDAVHVRVLAKDDADWERVERAAISLVGKPPSARLRAPSRPRDDAPAAHDWRLVRAILDDARAPMRRVCARAGMSHKTAKRRLDRLFARHHVRIEPVVSPAQAQGLVPFTLLVTLRGPGDTPELAALVPDGFVTRAPDSRLAELHGVAATLQEARDALRRARALPVVEEARMLLSTRRRARGWLAEALDAKAREVPAAAPSVAVAPRAK